MRGPAQCRASPWVKRTPRSEECRAALHRVAPHSRAAFPSFLRVGTVGTQPTSRYLCGNVGIRGGDRRDTSAMLNARHSLNICGETGRKTASVSILLLFRGVWQKSNCLEFRETSRVETLAGRGPLKKRAAPRLEKLLGCVSGSLAGYELQLVAGVSVGCREFPTPRKSGEQVAARSPGSTRSLWEKLAPP